eukprot:gene10092-21027_t
MDSQPRGLHNFISDIRNAASKDDERVRIDKELGNIRQKFAASANLSSYQKKKYVWKMCYIYMLGYDIDFGHMEMISLLSSTKFQEKSVGYMAISLLLRPGDEMMTLVVNSMRNDIVGQLQHGQTLALSSIANIGNIDLAEALSPDVKKLLMDTVHAPQYANPNIQITAETEARNKACVRKKAALCMLRLYRSNPDSMDMSEWSSLMLSLLEEKDMGLVTSVMSLLTTMAAANLEAFEVAVPAVVTLLSKLVVIRLCSGDYTYYKIPSPWLQMYRPPINDDRRETLNEALRKILIKSDTSSSDSSNKTNADHAILFEAISLMISYGSGSGEGEGDRRLYAQTLTLLGKFIA